MPTAQRIFFVTFDRDDFGAVMFNRQSTDGFAKIAGSKCRLVCHDSTIHLFDFGQIGSRAQLNPVQQANHSGKNQ